MFRLIRWLCFPIARALHTWPIGVYFILVLSLMIARALMRGGLHMMFTLPEAAQGRAPEWLLPAIYGFFLVAFPLLTLWRDRNWWRRQ